MALERSSRGAVQASGHFDRAALVDRSQIAEPAIQCFGIFEPDHPEVDFSGSFGSHYVRSAASFDHSRIYGDASPQVGEGRHSRDLASELQYGARATGEIETRVRGFAAYGDGVVADSFAGGFQLAFADQCQAPAPARLCCASRLFP